jgi:hypothetical protein
MRINWMPIVRNQLDHLWDVPPQFEKHSIPSHGIGTSNVTENRVHLIHYAMECN